VDDDIINLTNGDKITVEKNPNGDLAVKVENAVWVEPPRWIEVSVHGKHDREQLINDLIGALEQLRDADLSDE